MNYLDDNESDPLNQGKQMQRPGSPAGGSQPFGSPNPTSPAPLAGGSISSLNGGFAPQGAMDSAAKFGAQVQQTPSQPTPQPAQLTPQPAQPGAMPQKQGATMQPPSQPSQQVNLTPQQTGPNPAKQGMNSQSRRYYGEGQQ